MEQLDRAEIYDALYAFKNYQKDADQITQLIKHLNQNAEAILDLGCGTGNHHSYLTDEFQITGLDLNQNFIRNAKAKNPKAAYLNAKMQDFDINQEFDIVMSLFSSIGYVTQLNELKQTARLIHKHLKTGGYTIIEPWIQESGWSDGYIVSLQGETEDMKVSRMSYSTSEGQVSQLEFQFLVAQRDKGIHHFSENHHLRFFDKEEFLGIFREVGFEIDFHEEKFDHRGLMVGRKI